MELFESGYCNPLFMGIFMYILESDETSQGLLTNSFSFFEHKFPKYL